MRHQRVALALAALLLLWFPFSFMATAHDIRSAGRWYFSGVYLAVVLFLLWAGFTGAGRKGKLTRFIAFASAAIAALTFSPRIWGQETAGLLGISSKISQDNTALKYYIGATGVFLDVAPAICGIVLLYLGLRRIAPRIPGVARGPARPVMSVLCGAAAMGLGVGSLMALYFTLQPSGEEAWYQPVRLLPTLLYSILMAAGGRVAGGRREWLGGAAAGALVGVLRGPVRNLAGATPLGQVLAAAFDCTVVGAAGGLARGRFWRAIGGAFGGAVAGIGVALGARYMPTPELPENATFGQWADMLGPQVLAGVITGAIIWTLIVLGERVADSRVREIQPPVEGAAVVEPEVRDQSI